MVEAGGVEPPSEQFRLQASTCLALPFFVSRNYDPIGRGVIPLSAFSLGSMPAETH